VRSEGIKGVHVFNTVGGHIRRSRFGDWVKREKFHRFVIGSHVCACACVYTDDWLIHHNAASFGARVRGSEQHGDFGVNENAETRSIHRISYIIFSRMDVNARARMRGNK